MRHNDQSAIEHRDSRLTGICIVAALLSSVAFAQKPTRFTPATEITELSAAGTNTAYAALLTRTEPAALAAVDRMLGLEKDARVRRAAVAALDGRLRDPRARSLMKRVARDDLDDGVRRVAAAILRRLQTAP